jgi:hypothetical protein
MSVAVIGKGGYGCAIRPPLRCKGSETRKNGYISKLMKTRFAKTELSLALTVDKIDPAFKYHLPPPERCPADPSDILENEKELLTRCKKIGEGALRQSDEYSLLLYKDAGVDFQRFCNDVEKEPPTPETKQLCLSVLDQFGKLMEGVCLFRKKGFVMHDIKPQNIMYNGGNMVFIDFGLSWMKEALVRHLKAGKEHTGAVFHWTYPWETQFLERDAYKDMQRNPAYFQQEFSEATYQKEGDVPNTDAYMMWSYFTYVNSDKGESGQSIRSRAFSEFHSFLDKSRGVPYEEFLTLALDTLDTYCMGFTLDFFLYTLRHHIQDDDLAVKLEKLVEGMTTKNLYERLGPMEAKKRFDVIMRKKRKATLGGRRRQNYRGGMTLRSNRIYEPNVQYVKRKTVSRPPPRKTDAAPGARTEQRDEGYDVGTSDSSMLATLGTGAAKLGFNVLKNSAKLGFHALKGTTKLGYSALKGTAKLGFRGAKAGLSFGAFTVAPWVFDKLTKVPGAVRRLKNGALEMTDYGKKLASDSTFSWMEKNASERWRDKADNLVGPVQAELHDAFGDTSDINQITEADLETLESQNCIVTGINKETCKFPLTRFQKKVAVIFQLVPKKKKLLQNECGPAPAGRSEAKLNETQTFLQEYVTPIMPSAGLLLWHSTGAGKTCTAVAMASTFEAEGYTIVYVTMPEGLSGIKKNVWDGPICHSRNIHKATDKSTGEVDLSAIREDYASSWLGGPMSYKTFSNLLEFLTTGSGSNDRLRNHYGKIDNTPEAKARRKKDPLYKTFVILDEVQKLFSDELKNAKPNMNVLKKLFADSIELQEADPTYQGVKIILMTATPMVHSPFELMKILNLLRSRKEQLPETLEEFEAQGFKADPDQGYSVDVVQKLMSAFQGYISYLDMTNRRTQFARKVVHNVRVPMSEAPGAEGSSGSVDELVAERNALEAEFLTKCTETQSKKVCRTKFKGQDATVDLDEKIKKAKKGADPPEDKSQTSMLRHCAKKFKVKRPDPVGNKEAEPPKVYQPVPPVKGDLYEKPVVSPDSDFNPIGLPMFR